MAVDKGQNSCEEEQSLGDEGQRSVQDVIEGILEQERWKGQRASKLDLDDFLTLLSEFNAAGIHFR